MIPHQIAYEEVKSFFKKSVGGWTSHRNYYRSYEKGISPMKLKFEVVNIDDSNSSATYQIKAGKNEFTYRIEPFENIVTDCVRIIRTNSVSNIDNFPSYATLVRDHYTGNGIRIITDTPNGLFIEEIKFLDADIRTRQSLILSNSNLTPKMIGVYLETRNQ